jgi:hypothetical protein
VKESLDVVSELIGKRNLLIYLSLRIESLESQIKTPSLLKIPPEKRELRKRKILGRIIELRRLKGLVNGGHYQIKKESQRLWRENNLRNIL